MRRARAPRPSLARVVALSCAAALVLSACAGDDPTIDLADAPGDLLEDDEPDEEPTPEPEPGPEPEPDDEPTPAEDDVDEPEPSPAAEPDASLVADPCGPHAGREGEVFITVASPVEGQDLGDGSSVDLVGCSNVFEANVVWELHVGGEVVDEGFTTAACGNGCVGAFEDTIDLSAAGSGAAELHVLSPDMSDGEGDVGDVREVIAVTFG